MKEIETYQFKHDGRYFVFDVGSLNSFCVDKLIYDILSLGSKEESKIISTLKSEYNEPEIQVGLKEIKDLINSEFFTKQKPISGGELSVDGAVLKLHPTSRCNLNCKYCFNETKNNDQDMSVDVAKEAIDFLIEEFAPNSSFYRIDMSGSGEPLLRFDFIKDIVKYCRKKCKEIGKNIIVNFSTNGTLITDEVAKFISDNSDMIRFGISIDGDKKTHDSNRCYSDGRGSFENVIDGCRKISFNELIGLSVTVNAENTNITEIYKSIISLGFTSNMSIKLVRLFSNQANSINKNNILEVNKNYAKFAEYLGDEAIKGNIKPILSLIYCSDYFGNYIERLMLRRKVVTRCDGGFGSISIGADGKVSICPVMMDVEDAIIGNIYDGIDANKVSKFRKNYVDNLNECKKCWARYVCGGECYAVSYMQHKELFKPYNVMCEFKKNLIHIGIAMIHKIFENNKNSIDKMTEVIKEKGAIQY